MGKLTVVSHEVEIEDADMPIEDIVGKDKPRCTSFLSMLCVRYAGHKGMHENALMFWDDTGMWLRY